LKRVGIVGIGGIIAEELLRNLLNYKDKISIVYLGSKTWENKEVTDLIPSLRKTFSYKCDGIDKESILQKDLDVIFLARGHTYSINMVPWLLEANIKIIDLSADYRFELVEVYEEYYKCKHTERDLLKEAVYGLPELNRENIKKARLIANPGCYPTSVLLGLAPIVNIIKDWIIIHALSGISGAGKTYNKKRNNLFISCYENIRAYNVKESHQHIPEIKEKALKFWNKQFKVIRFTPHLVPINRGIYTTIYAETKNNYKLKELEELFVSFYKDEKFIRVLPNPEDIRIESIIRTNFCDISYFIEDNILQIFVVLDNLGKGGATQALQNMNLILGFPEDLGII
jgi:N-acetyl-gamma-glutamyl-phosphate reductase